MSVSDTLVVRPSEKLLCASFVSSELPTSAEKVCSVPTVPDALASSPGMPAVAEMVVDVENLIGASPIACLSYVCC